MPRRLRRGLLGGLRSLDLRRAEHRYGPDPSQVMTTWTPLSARPPAGWPTLLLLHGGGWVTGSRRDFDSFAPSLALRGPVLCAAVGYRLAPAHRWPAQLDDVQAAAEALPQLGADPDRVVAWGHSAGGQLALMALTRTTLAGVVALGAPLDLPDQVRREPGLERVFSPEQLRGASPAAVLGPAGPPIRLVHGTWDQVCAFRAAQEFQAARPARCTLDAVAGANHGLQWPPVRGWDARQRAARWALQVAVRV